MQLNPSLLIATASAFIGMGEEGPDNHGQIVEYFLGELHLAPGAPWCAAFVSHVGHWSHYDHLAKASYWPLPRTASCSDLGEFARAKGVLLTEPAPGDLFLRYSALRARFAHTGIVLSSRSAGGSDGIVCVTIEGNTNDDGSANGRMTLLRSRCLNPAAGDRFIRWTALANA